MAPPSYAKKPPKLIGNSLIVDFINTVGWRGRSENRDDRLTSYDELALWAAHVGIFARSEVPFLIAEARSRPAVAERILIDAISLRETVARLLAEPGSRDLTVLNDLLKRLPQRTRLLTRSQGGYRFLEETGDRLERPLWFLAWDAALTLVSDRRARIRSCQNQECGWMFLDQSLGRRRRWCSMDDCGNRAKARRHYMRQKKERALGGG